MSLCYSALHMVQILQLREGAACELLQNDLTARGGLDRWNCFDTVQASIVTGGQGIRNGGGAALSDSSSDHRTVPLN
jgi:hypothetical protein